MNYYREVIPKLGGMIPKLSMKYITELFLYRRGKYYYIDYMLLNDKETESKFFSYKAVKYDTFKSQLESLLKEYELC